MVGKPALIMLSVLLAGSTVLNVFQEIRFRTHAHTSASASLPNPDIAPIVSMPLPPSAKVPPLSVSTLNGRSATISFSEAGRPTVIYVFTPSCPWCARNLANIKSLLAERGSGFRFVGISLETQGLETYLRNTALTFPVFVSPTNETRIAYRFGNVPQTMVVSEAGVVIRNWMGAFGTPIVDEVERFFDIKLPGLTP